jgi:hypothetical protein
MKDYPIAHSLNSEIDATQFPVNVIPRRRLSHFSWTNMAKNTREVYRLPVLKDGRFHKALSHSVEEDESLFVMNRNNFRPRYIASGIPQLTPNGLRLADQTSTDMRSHHVHYHPSGALIVKARDNRTVARIQAPPMPMLSAPFLMFHLSVARIDQLAVDKRKPCFGDHAIDLSKMNVGRLQIECWVGPKGAFNNPFQWAFGPAQRIVYNDAGFYDVAYFAGEGAPIDPSIEIDGIKLSDTCLTAAPTRNIIEPSSVPALTPEMWASPAAVARQLRACFETQTSQFCSRLGHSSGSYEIKISLCRDGLIASVDWNSTINMPRLSWVRSDSLSCENVLDVVRQTGSADSVNIVDVSEMNPLLCGQLAGTVFVRVRESSNKQTNALIFRGSELLPGRYWRIPPRALERFSDIINLVHSA